MPADRANPGEALKKRDEPRSSEVGAPARVAATSPGGPVTSTSGRGNTAARSLLLKPSRLLLALVALGAAVGAAWWWTRPLPVAVAEASRGDAAEVVYATGIVEPRQWAKVSALVRKRIVDICRCEGKTVKKGDVLARLDDLEEKSVLSELQARRDRLKEDADRLKLLVERNVSSRVTYEEKLTQVREYDARLAAQKDRIYDLQLRAPMDGVVLRRDGEVGEIAGTGATDVLFWIGQPRPLRITAEVNEEDIVKVRTGQTVLLRHEGFGSSPLKAKVDEITPKGDPATKTFRVYFALPDDTPLKIGMSIEANVVVREAKAALLVPSESIRDGAVWVLDKGRLRRAAIETGIKGARRTEVISGLGEGDAVVSPFRTGLEDGMSARSLERMRP